MTDHSQVGMGIIHSPQTDMYKNSWFAHTLCSGIISLRNATRLCDGKDFVNKSARLKSDLTLKGIVIPAATLSLTL